MRMLAFSRVIHHVLEDGWWLNRILNNRRFYDYANLCDDPLAKQKRKSNVLGDMCDPDGILCYRAISQRNVY